MKLTKQYKRFTEQFKELQEKFRRFEQSDEKRINDIWKMNEYEVRALINKIMDADKVIHVQQLGITWEPPTNPIFMQGEGGAVGQSQMNPNTSVADSSKHGQSKMEEEKSILTGKATEN